MITDDIRDTFKHSYVGKVINDYDHKMLLISAILVYFRGLEGNVLDASESAVNTVDIDEDAQKDYITLHGLDKPENLSVQQIREYNTGTQVYLTGRVTPVNAMEDLKVTFLM
nr:phage tail sheath C-terminal domain-containing protein [Selenomonas bovis]